MVFLQKSMPLKDNGLFDSSRAGRGAKKRARPFLKERSRNVIENTRPYEGISV